MLHTAFVQLVPICGFVSVWSGRYRHV